MGREMIEEYPGACGQHESWGCGVLFRVLAGLSQHLKKAGSATGVHTNKGRRAKAAASITPTHKLA